MAALITHPSPTDRPPYPQPLSNGGRSFAQPPSETSSDWSTGHQTLPVPVQGGPATPAVDSGRKEKRHRNKPSLSCTSCTVKKTKCDRARPLCFACQKRKSECHYSHVADLIEESHRAQSTDISPKRQKVHHDTLPHQANPQTSLQSPAVSVKDEIPGTPAKRPSVLPSAIYEEFRPSDRTPSRSSSGSAPSLLSNIPFSHPTVSNLFKVEHPFSNYWTHQGGLSEVVGVLPSREQSDILVKKYFEAVDPVYPMIHRESFLKEYEDFWRVQSIDRKYSDGSLVALIFVMLAMGTQFVSLPSPEEQEQTAEFYISASHQALRVINYLARPSLRTMQTMILIIYFLMNDNHASDAWAFAGILTRHACALGLNRDPSITARNASPFDKQQRRKVWQAVLFQDTFFSVILKLPPNATHSDCLVDDLAPEIDHSYSIDGAADTSYIATMWRLANLVQPNLCMPYSLDLPISANEEKRAALVNQFESLYASLPAPFRTFNDPAICALASRSARLARQALFITSNYYHCMMLVRADEHEHLELDINGILEAAHQAINSYFLFHKLFEDEARVWYHFQHRAFSEALVIGELVKHKADLSTIDPKRMRAKDDIIRMIGILSMTRDHDLVARTRASVLSNYL